MATDAVDAVQLGVKVDTRTYGGKDMLTITINEVGTKLLKVDLGQNDEVAANAVLAMLFVESLGQQLATKAAEWRTLLEAQGLVQAAQEAVLDAEFVELDDESQYELDDDTRRFLLETEMIDSLGKDSDSDAYEMTDIDLEVERDTETMIAMGR